MHVILTPVGSAGDVNPFIVLGRELRRRGHGVTLLAADVFARSAVGAGLNFKSIGSTEEYEQVTSNPDLWHPRHGLAVVLDTIARQLRRAYATLEDVYEPNRTMLVGHSLAFVTRVFEEVHHVPAATVHLAPSILRSEFNPPALPSGADISWWPRWAKRGLWWAVDRYVIDPLIAPALNAWRAQLGLSAVSHVFRSWLHSPQCVLGLFPDWFGPPQPDWPSQLRLVGFVLSDHTCAPAQDGLATAVLHRAPASDECLEQFFGAGDAPIIFTPGSANRHARRFFDTAIEATHRMHRRALLVTGYRDHLPPSLPPHVQHAPYVPFSTWFSRAAVVVHHGGIGTCAQALAAGTPQVIMPMGFDQPDNAHRAARLGVAETISPKHFTPGRVVAALDRLLAGPEVAAACRRWRERLESTDAVLHACNLIEQHFDQHGERLLASPLAER